MFLKSPKDKIAHALICFLLALWHWDYSIVMGLTIEGTQIESEFINWDDVLKKEWWKYIFSKDRIGDLIADGIGICIALLIKRLV